MSKPESTSSVAQPLSEAKSRELPHRLRKTISRMADSLANAYEVSDTASNNPTSQVPGYGNAWEYYENEKNYILNHKHINHVLEGSGRIAAVIGSTFEGELIYDDRGGIVVKFQPWLCLTDEKFRKMRENADNRHELRVWRQAVSQNDTDLFASVYDASETGHWLVMEQCLPIYRNGPPMDAPSHDYLRDNCDQNLISEFSDRFADRGWYEHDLSHGNVGLDGRGDTVLLDYGSFTGFKG